MAKQVNNISFDEGVKEYTINNDPDRVLRINTSDISLLTRADEAEKNIDAFMKRYNNIKINPDGTADADDETALQAVKEITEYVREQIDYIFNAPVCKIAFGNTNPLSTYKGVTLYERFLNGVMPIIKADIEAENKEAQKRAEKYTKEAQRFKNKVSKR